MSEKKTGYVCFYERKRVEVHATGAYEAQNVAKAEFQKMFPRRKVKGHQIAVVAAEHPDGTQIVHSTAGL